MSVFDQELPAFRLIETYKGDTLQTIAARVLGDANQWVDLVWLNKLVHPYITDDASIAGANVLLSGTLIKVPAATGYQFGQEEPGQAYERDCKMQDKRLQVDAGGDILVVAGVDNLRQQLKNRVDTPRGQLVRHPTYGCLIYRLRGRRNNPSINKMAAEYLRSTLQDDYRVESVENVLAEISGDKISVRARAVAIEGGAIDLTGGAS